MMDRLAHVVARLICAFRGHNALLHFDDNTPPRIMLRCSTCGWTSPGLDVRVPRDARRI